MKIPNLVTETVKYTNENSFIENLAALKYSIWAQRGKMYIDKQYIYILHVQTKSCPVCKTCKQVCVSKLLSAKKDN